MKIEMMNDAAALASIVDWHQLGQLLSVKANIMAYALKNRDNLQKRISFDKRVVYKSSPSLARVQKKLGAFLAQFVTDDCVIAYRKGVSAVDVVRNVPHAKTLVKFDIRHFYDNIRLERHIVPALEKCGFCEAGAKLAGRYCIVKNGNLCSLQQGSAASPVVSNLVGYYFIDEPLRAWLLREWPGVNVSYLRYSDNVALFVHNDAPEGFYPAYKKFVKEELGKSGFHTHKWAKIADNNPVAHQKFLGMVINAEARSELEIYDRLRAILLNCVRFGITQGADEFYRSRGVYIDSSLYFINSCASLRNEYFMRHIKGHVAYISRISEKQGLVLRKLLAAAEYSPHIPSNYFDSRLIPASVFEAIKKYRDDSESVEDYLERVKNAIAA